MRVIGLHVVWDTSCRLLVFPCMPFRLNERKKDASLKVYVQALPIPPCPDNDWEALYSVLCLTLSVCPLPGRLNCWEVILCFKSLARMSIVTSVQLWVHARVSLSFFISLFLSLLTFNRGINGMFISARIKVRLGLIKKTSNYFRS